ncbi:MAG: hypothetical protein LBP59_01530 [Planctomycetaceae bacterium]|jgi:hypothetical protein|nr:hypothetical protein [Planctomycetaceae bacterium]
MTAIYYGYMSANYAATFATKSSSANSTTQTTNQTETTTQPAKDYPYVDVVTFSQEALEASEKLSVEDAEPRILDLSPKKYWYDSIERNNTENNTNNNNSKTNSLITPKYESNEEHRKTFKLIQGKESLSITKIYSDKWQNTITKIDDKITEILNENDIDLTKDETLNFSINQDGKITIGNKISEYKKTILEKIFNEDNELRAELIDSHYSIVRSQPYISTAGYGISTYGADHDPNSDLLSVHLMRNYGLSISDFVITSEEERLAGALPIKFKDGSNNDELLLKMFTEEAETFDNIVNNLMYEQTTGQKGYFTEFEYNFSYKNGVTIEKGQGDQYSLDKRYQFIWDDSGFSLGFFPGFDTTNAALTINPSGKIVDSQIIAQSGTNNDKNMVSEPNLDLFIQKLEDKSNNEFQFQSWLQQYVFESQRLAKYKTGQDTENMNLVINRTFHSEDIQNYRI